MRTALIAALFSVTFVVVAQTPEEIGKKVAEATAMKPGPARTARFEKLTSECDRGERTNSKDLFDRAFELHKVAVESIGSEPQIPDSNGAIDSKNPQARRDLTVPPATSANASEQSAASGRSTVASTLPSLVFKAEPTYTEMARVFKISGSVQLSIVVGRSGRAESIQLLQGLGLGLDEQAAR